MNVGVDVAPSATRTGAGSADFDVPISNPDGQFARLVVDVTARNAPGALVVTIQRRDPLTGKKITILASASLAAVGTVELKVGPGLPVTANLSANDVMPKDVNINFAHSGGGDITYAARLDLLGSH